MKGQKDKKRSMPVAFVELREGDLKNHIKSDGSASVQHDLIAQYIVGSADDLDVSYELILKSIAARVRLFDALELSAERKKLREACEKRGREEYVDCVECEE